MTGEFRKLKEYLAAEVQPSELQQPQAAFSDPVFKTFFLAARSRRPVSKLDPVLEELGQIIRDHPELVKVREGM